MVQLQLELERDLTRCQPPQVSVVNVEDGNVRIVLITTAGLFRQQQAVELTGCYGGGASTSSALPSNLIRGSDFRVSERYLCIADSRGQVQGGVGFIFQGVDLVENIKA